MEQEEGVGPEVGDRRVPGTGGDVSGPGEREHFVLGVRSASCRSEPAGRGRQRGPLPLGHGPTRSSPDVAAGSPWLPLGLHVLVLLEGLFLSGTSVATSQRPLFLKHTV